MYVSSTSSLHPGRLENLLSLLPALVRVGEEHGPPPSIVTTSLVHRELHMIPVRLVHRGPTARGVLDILKG